MEDTPDLVLKFRSNGHRQAYYEMVRRMNSYRNDGTKLGPSVEILYRRQRKERK
ncbi:hypothetical protein HN832_01240 [archaeon]|jgi:hypothetical protein|nr:hypothetical protein [archaeon]MBT4373897.1 hypothetical protein [archaeon]MBT4532174.1 hypothetical protein [archaeon]MBT7001127.1 hypothetical protein [archaeon]MBT7282016.1 hypothetical protein [archaeon]